MAHIGRHEMGWSDVRKGADVYAADDKKIGNVADVTPEYVHVSKGFLFTKDLYIPKNAIRRVEDGKVYLSAPSDRIESMNWTEPQRGRFTEREGDVRMPVREEELEVGKTMRKVGEVEISKEVTEEKRTMRVPRVHEEVTVERERVDRPAEGPIEKGEHIRVPIREEEIHVEKRPVVKEELVVRRRPVVKEEEVTETVRKEHPRIERHGAEEHHERPTGEHYERPAGMRPHATGREEYITVQRGWDVYCSDGKKIGDVGEVTPEYIHVKKGFLFTKDLWIPADAVDFAEQGKVYLRTPCDKVESMPWYEAPKGRRIGM